MILLVDTGVLGQIVHPRKFVDVRARLPGIASAHDILVSEVCDYELRRELLRIDSRRSLRRLDELGRELRYVTISTSTWRVAARLWAATRRAGAPTGDGLDADLLVAAQAIEERAVVVTDNPKHFEGLVGTTRWSDVPV